MRICPVILPAHKQAEDPSHLHPLFALTRWIQTGALPLLEIFLITAFSLCTRRARKGSYVCQGAYLHSECRYVIPYETV